MHTNNSLSRVTCRAAICILSALIFGCARPRMLTADNHWVTTWGCGPQLTEPGNLPPAPLANSTLRQFVRTTLGGKQLRVRFSNAYGTEPVTVKSVHVAMAAGKGSAGDGEINAATDKALAFNGEPSVIIPPGESVFSDPFDFELPTITDLAVTINFGDISARTINGHPGSRTTSFIVPGDSVSAANMVGAAKTKHWYIITGIEVMAANTSTAIAVLGDSITDGRGSTDDGNNRWPDVLAERLAHNSQTAGVAVVNMGIGGNGIFGGLGPSAEKRFDRDILDQNGVRYLIIFEGVNDIGGRSSMTTATNLVNAYIQFANKAHARNILVYGATITPFGGNGYYSPVHEEERQFVNAWIRTNTVFDAVIDFDAVVRDPGNPVNFKREYFPGLNANDGLHLNPAGYKAMADAIDLTLFTR